MVKNPLHFVSIHDVQFISTQTVVFVIDLKGHSHLRSNPSLIEVSMDTYMSEYPAVESWSGEIKGRWLYIKVTGDMDPVAVSRFKR